MRLAPRLITRKSPRSDDLAHLHHSLLRSLATKQPSMPDACRLLVRWCHAQWLSDYVQQAHLELVCAAAFAPLAANSGVGEVPAAARAGFVACLRVLATHDFSNRALYVDLRRATDEARPIDGNERASFVARRPQNRRRLRRRRRALCCRRRARAGRVSEAARDRVLAFTSGRGESRSFKNSRTKTRCGARKAVRPRGRRPAPLSF